MNVPYVYKAKYVDVVALHTADGTLDIKQIIYDMDHIYDVSKTVSLGYSAAPSGGGGKCYQITIGSKVRKIWWQKDRFFVCRKEPAIGGNYSSDMIHYDYY